MENNIIRFNSYKLERGGLLYDMYDQFNARVGDQGTPLVMQWTQGLADTLIDLQAKKLHFYAAGKVGQYLEKLKDGTGYQMSADASQVEYEDRNAAGTMDHGITKVKLPKQFFPQEGIFYGYFGLKDDQGNTYTSVNVWFRVLGGVPIMGAAIPYFSTRFDELMETCQGRIEDVLAQLRQEYQDEVKKNQDMSAETRAALSKLATTAGTIQAQIDANNFESRSDHNHDYKELSEMIERKLANMSDNIEWLQNEISIKTKYPNGAEGLKIAVDTNHKWLWFNNAWTDCGVYQAAEDPATARNRFIAKTGDLKMPYDDLDTLPVNSVVTYVPGLNVSNCPTAITGNYTVHTIGASADASNAVGAIQMLFSEDNSSYYYRSAWGYPGTKWSAWQACADSKIFIHKDELVSPYNNLDLLPSGSIITYVNGILTNDFPFTAQGFTIITNGKGFPEAEQAGIAAGKVQFAITSSPTNLYYRIAWGSSAKWSKWQSLNNSYVFTSKDGLIDQYKDLDTLPAGSTVTYVAGILEHEFPYIKNSQGFTIVTNGSGFPDDDVIKAGQIQRVTCTDGSEYHRIAWGSPAKWSAWQIDSYESQMQDINLPSLAIFKKFGVIGDSFSKGYIQKPDGTVLNETDNKWGAFMAKQYGTQFTDLSVSGQTTQSCVDNTLPTLKASGPLDAYFIVMGINDEAPDNKTDIGSIDDIKASANDNPRTFFGDYGRIISAALTTSPSARIILFTIMANWGDREKYDAAIKEIGNHYNLPVIDILTDPYFSSDEYTSLLSGGHPTVVGYGILANHLMKLIQKCVVDNPDYFNFMGC